MSEPAHDLERLISRHLDHESTSTERRELNARLRRDPDSAALFEEYAALDREIKHVLRSALGHVPGRFRPRPVWQRAARGLIIAAAACLALLLWLRPAHHALGPGGPAPAQARSWFAPLPSVGDKLVEHPARFDRPQIRVGKPATDWIMIPAETPGEFLVIEVNRLLTRTIHIQRDF
jgi:anti-sigma factor RsiW